MPKPEYTKTKPRCSVTIIEIVTELELTDDMTRTVVQIAREFGAAEVVQQFNIVNGPEDAERILRGRRGAGYDD